MYKEYAKLTRKTTLLIIGLIGAVLVLAAAVNTLITYFNLPYRSLYQFLILASVSSGVYFFIKNILFEYEYALTDDELIITVNPGQNKQIRTSIAINSIEIIAFHNNPSVKSKKISEKYSAKKSLLCENTYICIFNKNNKICALYFEPSEKLLELLKEKDVQTEK